MRRIWVLLGSASVLAGCLGDPPPDPSVAPLEVVTGSTQNRSEPCLVNRDEVGAGTHELVVIAEGGPVTVSVRDSARTIVFRTEASVGGGEVVPGSVELEAGSYVVECAPTGDSTSEVALRVTP